MKFQNLVALMILSAFAMSCGKDKPHSAQSSKASPCKDLTGSWYTASYTSDREGANNEGRTYEYLETAEIVDFRQKDCTSATLVVSKLDRKLGEASVQIDWKNNEVANLLVHAKGEEKAKDATLKLIEDGFTITFIDAPETENTRAETVVVSFVTKAKYDVLKAAIEAKEANEVQEAEQAKKGEEVQATDQAAEIKPVVEENK